MAEKSTDGAPVQTDDPAVWLIRKGAYYYRPNCQGYTSDPAAAGHYTRAKAEAECAVEPWHMSVEAAPLPPPASPADRFAAIMWGHFIDGCSIDGADLQDALEKSGMGEWRAATAADTEGKWAGEVEEGDRLLFLTPAGKACVNAGAKSNG